MRSNEARRPRRAGLKVPALSQIRRLKTGWETEVIRRSNARIPYAYARGSKVNQGLVIQSRRRVRTRWPLVTLLLALVLVGHDLMMTSPMAHAAPLPELGHHQDRFHMADPDAGAERPTFPPGAGATSRIGHALGVGADLVSARATIPGRFGLTAMPSTRAREDTTSSPTLGRGLPGEQTAAGPAIAPAWESTRSKTPHGASQCPANRVAKAPSGISVDAEGEAVNAGAVMEGFVQELSNIGLPGDSPPPLSAGTRRALLQVFLM